jgi:hypothetical protein
MTTTFLSRRLYLSIIFIMEVMISLRAMIMPRYVVPMVRLFSDLDNSLVISPITSSLSLGTPNCSWPPPCLERVWVVSSPCLHWLLRWWFMGLARASIAGLCSKLALKVFSTACRYCTMGYGISGFVFLRTLPNPSFSLSPTTRLLPKPLV